MNIELKKITIRELVEGFIDNNEDGVVGYGGKLDIRPAYQREFIYNDAEKKSVINSIIQGFPLNIMYWSICSNGRYELIDGQQRTLSICNYIEDDFTVDISGNPLMFGNLDMNYKEIKKRILDYELTIYLCSGTNQEKLEWFNIINIAGKILTNQELRNAIYSGTWVTDAKKYFSKTGCAAKGIGSNYLLGNPLRQDYLETVIKWITGDKNKIEDYMSQHQNDENSNHLREYFKNVIEWIETIFPKCRPKIMKGVNWGNLYNQYKDIFYDSVEIENRINKLILDDEVTKKSGVYSYILTDDEKYLNIRTFKQGMKNKIYELQKGLCRKCENHFELNEVEADHIIPWSKGGKTNEDNCQILCRKCNRTKSNK